MGLAKKDPVSAMVLASARVLAMVRGLEVQATSFLQSAALTTVSPWDFGLLVSDCLWNVTKQNGFVMLDVEGS